MARDKGLEELMIRELDGISGISEKAMFGGWAWLLNGKLLAAARQSSLLIRIGRENEGWALATHGVGSMMMRGKRIAGWIRANPDAYGDDNLRRRLIHRRNCIRLDPPG